MKIDSYDKFGIILSHVFFIMLKLHQWYWEQIRIFKELSVFIRSSAIIEIEQII